jgi:hypothetical protein
MAIGIVIGPITALPSTTWVNNFAFPYNGSRVTASVMPTLTGGVAKFGPGTHATGITTKAPQDVSDGSPFIFSVSVTNATSMVNFAGLGDPLAGSNNFLGFSFYSGGAVYVSSYTNNVQNFNQIGTYTQGALTFYRMTYAPFDGVTQAHWAMDQYNGTSWVNLASPFAGTSGINPSSIEPTFVSYAGSGTTDTMSLASLGEQPYKYEAGSTTLVSGFSGTLRRARTEAGTATVASSFAGTLKQVPNRKLETATTSVQSSFSGTIKQVPNKQYETGTASLTASFGGSLKIIPNRQPEASTILVRTGFSGSLYHNTVDVSVMLDATQAYVGTKSLNVSIAKQVLPRVPLIPGAINLIANPNGDLGDTYIPYGSSIITYFITAADFVEGTHSIALNSINVPTDQGVSTQFVPVTPEDTYTFSTYLKQTAGTENVTIRIQWMNGVDNVIGASEFTTSVSGSWQRYSVSGEAPDGTTDAFVTVYFPAVTDPAQSILINGMQFEDNPVPTPYVLGSRLPYYGPNNQPYQGAQTQVTNLIPGHHYVASGRVQLDTASGCTRVIPISFPGIEDAVPDTELSIGVGTDGDVPFDGTWYQVSVPFVALQVEHTVAFCIDQDDLPTVRTSPVDFWLDAVVIESGDIAGSYFDGSLGPDYMWEVGGTPGLARSYYYGDLAHRSGVLNLLLKEYTAAGTNVGIPQFGIPRLSELLDNNLAPSDIYTDIYQDIY